MRKMFKYLILTIVVILLITFGLSMTKNRNRLSAVKVEQNNYHPIKGLDSDEARRLIVTELVNQGAKGPVDKAVVIEEISTQQLWDNINVQLFSVELDYAWIDAVAIIKDKEVLSILNGMPTMGIFIADLDGDNFYEVYSNIAFGSGLVSYEILGYNIAKSEKYHLVKRSKQDYKLLIEEGVLKAEVSSFNLKNNNKYFGELYLKNDKGVKVLDIKKR